MCSCPTKSEPSKSRPTVYLIFVAVVLVFSVRSLPTKAASLSASDSQGDVDQYHYTGARPYMDEPLKQLVKRISQLKNLRPAKSVGVTVILQKTGERVDEFCNTLPF